jgi:type VI protein secretion system component VasF
MDVWGGVAAAGPGLIDDLWTTPEEQAQADAVKANATAALTIAQNAPALEAERTKRAVTVAAVGLGGVALLAGAYVFARSMGGDA